MENTENEICSEMPKKNLTAEWFENNIDLVFRILRPVLGRKFRKSYEIGLIDDHIMDFVLKCIEKDNFRPVIIAGKRPTNKSIVMFAIRTTIDRLRVNGGDYGCRVMYGSNTSKEFRKDERMPDVVFKDHHVDEIEKKLYLKDRIGILLDRILLNADEDRHDDLISIVVHAIKNGEFDKNDLLLEEFDSRDIMRVIRIAKQSANDMMFSIKF
jgi:serine/threonine protein kinase